MPDNDEFALIFSRLSVISNVISSKTNPLKCQFNVIKGHKNFKIHKYGWKDKPYSGFYCFNNPNFSTDA